jgi:hypothetical protein
MRLCSPPCSLWSRLLLQQGPASPPAPILTELGAPHVPLLYRVVIVLFLLFLCVGNPFSPSQNLVPSTGLAWSRRSLNLSIE